MILSSGRFIEVGFIRTTGVSSQTKFLWLVRFVGFLECKKPLRWRSSRICLRVSRSFDEDSIPCLKVSSLSFNLNQFVREKTKSNQN